MWLFPGPFLANVVVRTLLEPFSSRSVALAPSVRPAHSCTRKGSPGPRCRATTWHARARAGLRRAGQAHEQLNPWRTLAAMTG